MKPRALFKDIFRFLLIICIVMYTIPYSAQVIKTKDGVEVGDRKEIISSCSKGFDQRLVNINGLEIETYKYCACFCDNLLPNLNSWELEKFGQENKMIELFRRDENQKILMKCLEGNVTVADDYTFSSSDNPKVQKELGIENCVIGIMNDEEMKDVWTEKLAEEYCDCAINKLYSAGYTYKDILEIEDENSKSFNEIAMPCINQVLKNDPQFNSANTYNKDDIKGGGIRTLIPLVDYLGQGYKIKISISGITKYYLFDTGASDLIIDRDTERELLLDGVLKRDDYLGKTEYTLANNQIVEAQKVRVNNITIGDYTLNNVVIGVIDEGSLLCGKSFLDKFVKWEIDKQNNYLILYK
jgi:hypothetical protein